MKRILTILLALAMVLALSACGTAAAPAAEKKDEVAEAPVEESKTLSVAFIIPATESQFWNQQCGGGSKKGAEDWAAENGYTVEWTMYGPSAETETDKFSSIFESVISTAPDVYIVGNMAPEITGQLIKKAWEQGGKVGMFSPIEGEGCEEWYVCNVMNDQAAQGALAGEAMVEQLKAMGLDAEAEGYVGIHIANIVPVLEDKIAAFKGAVAESFPKLVLLDTLYNNGDVQLAQANVEDQIAAYGDKLVAVFGGNNISGDGCALAIKNAGIQDQIACVVIDSDQAEIEALRDGIIDVICVQTPYDNSYNATQNALNNLVFGTEYEKEISADSVNVTKDIMEDSPYAELLDPSLLG